MTTLFSNLFIFCSDQLLHILSQKTARFAVHGMEGYAALIKSSEFDRSETKLSCEGCDRGAGIHVITRNEYDLSPLLLWRIGSKLSRRQVIEGLDDACFDKGFGHYFRGKFWRRIIKGVCGVDNDLAFPLLKLLGDLFVSWKWDSQQDDRRFTGVSNRLRDDARTEFLRKGREGVRAPGVRDGDVDFLSCKGAGECRANFSRTNDGVLHI